MPTMPIGQFFGLSLTVGALITGLTQALKVTQTIPFLSKVPLVQRLVNAVAKGNVIQVRAFVAVLCVILSTLAAYLQTGALPELNAQFLLFNLKAFFDATAGYTLLRGSMEREVVVSNVN